MANDRCVDRQKETPRRTPPRVGIRPGCHAHVFVSMECLGLLESLGHAHEVVSMVPKSLAQHHLRFISWSRGGVQRGVSTKVAASTAVSGRPPFRLPSCLELPLARLGRCLITPATKKVILTRSVSEGPGVYPSLTLRVSMRSMRNLLAGVIDSQAHRYGQGNHVVTPSHRVRHQPARVEFRLLARVSRARGMIARGTTTCSVPGSRHEPLINERGINHHEERSKNLRMSLWLWP